MAREHIEFIYAQQLDWIAGCAIPDREAARWKRLSVDETSGELSALLRWDAGWTATVRHGFEEELLVLDGALTIDGTPLRREGYARLAAGGETRWSVEPGTAILLFLNYGSATSGTGNVLVDTTMVGWTKAAIPAEMDFMRAALKPLHCDSNGSLRTWLLSVAPQSVPSGKGLAIETHGCAEEAFMLGGDITGPEGVMSAGAYFWRPRETVHGPFGSRLGGFGLFRFRDGVQTTNYHDEIGAFQFDAPYRPRLPASIDASHHAPPIAGLRF